MKSPSVAFQGFKPWTFQQAIFNLDDIFEKKRSSLSPPSYPPKGSPRVMTLFPIVTSKVVTDLGTNIILTFKAMDQVAR